MSEIFRQATCVVLAGASGPSAVLIEGAPGSGKSSLALALIDRGAQLLGDDGVMLIATGGRLLARPHPNTRGLLEVRNLGLLEFPICDEAPVALVLNLDKAAPRFIEAAELITIAGQDLPLLRLWPGAAALPLKTELALAKYGLFRS
ncbi:MAG: serine kinase [Novosphingobium sp.]|nr:serine kinase [Novosphingobium sp.]